MQHIRSVILVHGAFVDGSSWSKVIGLISKRGLEIAAVQNPLTSLNDDVAAVKRALKALPVPALLVGHSWGGAVITEAGNDDRVAGLVYVAAGAPDQNESFNDWWGKYPPSAVRVEIRTYGDDGFLYLTFRGVKDFFAEDLSEAEVFLIEATQGLLAARCFDDKITEAAWRRKPSWYIVAENDQTIPPSAQHDAAGRMKADKTIVASSHAVVLSNPSKAAEVILRAIDEFSKTDW